MFNLKKYVCIVTLCFLTALLAPQCSVSKEELKRTSTDQQKAKSDQKQVPADNQPRISFDSTRYDAGTVWEGDVIVHDFNVKNTGTGLLNIAKVKPG